jgi:hypothetical protein
VLHDFIENHDAISPGGRRGGKQEEEKRGKPTSARG